MILILDVLFSSQREKKKSICRNANEMFINATVTTPQLRGRGAGGGAGESKKSKGFAMGQF